MIDMNNVLKRLTEELNREYPLYDGMATVSQDDLRAVLDEIHKLRKELSWIGQVDHMSGAFDPNDRHEMGG